MAGLGLFTVDATVGEAAPAHACVNRGQGDSCRGPRLSQTQAEEEESNRMGSGGPSRTRRRSASPRRSSEEQRRHLCEVSCGEETADMLNRSLNDAEGTRIANAYGRACTAACSGSE